MVIVELEHDGAVYTFDLDTDRLGKGNYGVVFLASMRLDSNVSRVALKRINKEMAASYNVVREDFQREAEILHKLSQRPQSSQYVARYIDSFEDAENFYLVSEYVDAVPVDWKRELLPDTLLAFAIESLRGLKEIHRAGVAHRDIKLENIVIDRRTCAVRFIDFGLACDTVAFCQEAVGNPLYLPPEVQRDDPSTNYQVLASEVGRPRLIVRAQQMDVWALGVTFYRLAHKGNYPFRLQPVTYHGRKMLIPDYTEMYRGETPWPEFNLLLMKMLQRNPIARITSEEAGSLSNLQMLSQIYEGCLIDGRFVAESYEECKHHRGRYISPIGGLYRCAY